MEPARSRPPLDPTVAPSVARLPLRDAPVSRAVVRRPVLASECLKDDVAPIEPHALVFRIVTAVLGLACVAAAILGGPFFVVALMGGALAGAMLVSDYALRARIALGASVLAVCVATYGLALRGGLPLLALRVVAPIALSVVLFVRATYRAHRMTRVALAAALLLFVVAAASAAVLPGPPRLAAAAMCVVSLLSLLGFMSDQTTGGCAVWSGLALVTGLGAIALDHTELAWMLSASFVALAGIAVAVSAFQVAALRIAPTERARDSRGSALPPPPVTDMGEET